MDLIVKMKFGSVLYGTATSESDIDYKGVFLPAREEVLLGRIPKSHRYSSGDDASRNRPGDVDLEIYSLHYFIKLACEGQTVAMDMLHAPESMLIESSDIWESIVRERHRFYSKNLRSFVSYSRRQAAKYGIKGSRLSAVQSVLDVLKGEKDDMKLRDVWERLPRGEHCGDAGNDPNGFRQYRICGKIFQESAAVGYVAPILEKFRDEYGERARLAAENRNIDWKAISHAFRAAIQTKEILTANTITYPLKDAAFLIRVKEGRLDYSTEAAPLLESLMDEVEGLLNKSGLPEYADIGYWDDFICKTLENERFRT